MKNSKMWMGIATLFCALACGCKAKVEETGDAAESTSTSTDECDPALDYAQQEVQCGDGDPCTVDRCDLALKTCINRRIQDCITKGPQCSDVTAPSDCSKSANPCYSGKCNDAGLCMVIPGCYSK